MKIDYDPTPDNLRLTPEQEDLMDGQADAT
jgi:hypothetical protein